MKVRTKLGLAALFCTLVAPPHGRAQTSVSTPVTVQQINYHGWDGTFEVSNGIVYVVVVPGIGRIMEYAFAGNPETSPIRLDPAQFGKSYDSSQGWQEYGGSKIWAAPQSDWGKHGSRDPEWPPDPTIGDGPFTATILPNGLRLDGPDSPNYALHVERDITLAPGSSRLTIVDRFIKDQDPPPDKDGFPVAIWDDTQTRGDAVIFAPLPAHSKVGPHGFVALLDSDPAGELNWNWTDHMLAVIQTAVKATKVGIDDREGWIAALYGGNILFSQRETYDPKGPYLDAGTNAQIYTKDYAQYMEMELYSPGKNLKTGETLTLTTTWNLQLLPKTPANWAEARTLVRAAMR